MSGEVKQFLNTWCAKQKITPNYEVRAVGSKIRPRFMCEVGLFIRCYVLVIHILLAVIEDDRWRTKILYLGITPWAPPHAYAKWRWENPAGTQHNPVLGCRVVLMT